ncbi:MAG TPA: polymer-forming cytoskeletal protein [Gemmatimonadota bacterium]|nr:polymer-forming cytoskeletal protein [Gemmatimonadota bacterium]
MNRLARTLAAALIVAGGALATPPGVDTAMAQTDTLAQERPTLAALRQAIEDRYQVLPIQNGIVLIPRYGNAGIQSIELSDGDIAIDGAAVTGAEFRARVGEDADEILRLSYLDVETRRVLFGIGEPPLSADTLGSEATVTAGEDADEIDEDRGVIDVDHQGDRVRIGGSVVVREGETIEGDVVAVGGSVRIYGRVTGDVSAVGGSVHLGPRAVVEGDITAAGGEVIRSDGAEVHGSISETAWGAPNIQIRRHMDWEPFEGVAGLVTTVMWIVFLGLLTSLAYLLARRPIERMEYRVATSPWKAAAVGLLAQILFFPILFLTTLMLVISIVGIPLLVAIPFALMALAVGMLLGFTAVARRIGASAEERFGWRHDNRYVSLLVGVGLVMAVAFFAAALGIAGGPLGVFAVVLSILGFVIQYIVWTMGFGALLLTRFGTRYSWNEEETGAPAAPPPADATPVAPPPPPQGEEPAPPAP